MVGVTCSSAEIQHNWSQMSRNRNLHLCLTAPSSAARQLYTINGIIRLINMWLRVILSAGKSTSWKYYSNSSVFYCSSVSHSIKSSFITDMEVVNVYAAKGLYIFTMTCVVCLRCHLSQGAWRPPSINTHINTQ